MKNLFAVLFTTIAFSLFANDGAYRSSGGVIYPVKETKISLEKEFLSFTIRDRIAQVDIRFEFNNPEKVERKLLVGFQASAPSGGVPEEMCNRSQIANFSILNTNTFADYSDYT